MGFMQLSVMPRPGDRAVRIALPTLGGRQFWTDVRHFHQWRIQQHARSGRCRLLDGDDTCQATGAFDLCLAMLERIEVRQQLPAMRGKAVILLHGLGRTRASMSKLAAYLNECGGYNIFNISYASTRTKIAESAGALKQIIDHLDGIEEINLVTHSLGGIVLRHYLSDMDERVQRFVMLAPPNHRSEMAQKMARVPLFKMIAGNAGQQLGRDWDKLAPHLATPRCDFGIIAGGAGNRRGYSPLLPGDNDGTVTVASTRLTGAADFRVVPVGHTFIVEDEAVLQSTLRFLQQGFFTTEAERQPIEHPRRNPS